MQKMEKSLDSDRHYYILPLPEGLHQQSANCLASSPMNSALVIAIDCRVPRKADSGASCASRVLQHPAPNLLTMVKSRR